MTDSPIVTRHLRLHGRVQGVYFRESMSRKAAQLGITGWVRNCRDGTVEAMVQGSEEAVAGMLDWARRGPERAGVTHMDVTEGSGVFTAFERRGTV
jgi:acylphosphatase